MIADAHDRWLHDALNPRRSVVVSACAGSGKTWLLVSRIVRLLLSGVTPSEILAITFTRNAAQEMAARLREWLQVLASEDEATVRGFLRERAVSEEEIEAAIERGRGMHEEVLCAQPGITISTFHSWYLQLLRSAPLSAGAIGNLTLTEQTSALVSEAWALFAAACQRDPRSAGARGLQRLFEDHGLWQTRSLLSSFLQHRADWWSYAGNDGSSVDRALAAQSAALGLSADADLPGELFADARFVAEAQEIHGFLLKNTPTDRARAEALASALACTDRGQAFEQMCGVFYTDTGEVRKVKSTKTQAQRLGSQGEARYLELHARLAERVGATNAGLCDQASLRCNADGLAAGVNLLEAYQRLKRDRQVADFADVEWLAFDLLCRNDQAITLQFKLDSRYRHILLDEFQDTNPLQWLALQAWFEAAAQADSHPVVFLVGDPKQAIYRFRRAESRLFDAAREWLVKRQDAHVLSQDESRRCAQPVLEVVNEVFTGASGHEDYRLHSAHHTALPGRVEVWPLARSDEFDGAIGAAEAVLRDPLQQPRRQAEDRRREQEACSLVDRLRHIVAHWEIVADAKSSRRRRASFADVMILVQRRTHLQVYERVLRHAGIPFRTSRQGGLLDTLEASDMIALLGFLVSPFDDLKLAQALRSPIFGCSDDDLLALAANPGGSWWQRLLSLPFADDDSTLGRARKLLALWLERADRLPVHDHLDRIYFEADIERRYAEAVPAPMQALVVANLRAFLERALEVDSGRYPSLPRFIDELRDLAAAPLEEAPDEGTIDAVGDAVRILTVHGAKGLEAPIVWLLDSGAQRVASRGYEVLVDWPPGAEAPASFSLRTRTDQLSRVQRARLEAERRHDEREDGNLLYVAMTRAQQALIVSGCDSPTVGRSWYQRIRSAVATRLGESAADTDRPLTYGDDLTASAGGGPAPVASREKMQTPLAPDPPAVLPTGSRRESLANPGQAYGETFHAVMDFASRLPAITEEALMARLGITRPDAGHYLEQARRLMSAPALRRFFDESQYLRAFNELSLALDDGKLRRLDRVVEFEREAWVLDYKTGRRESLDGSALEAEYRAQVTEYCAALRQVFVSKPVFGALVFADGAVIEVGG